MGNIIILAIIGSKFDSFSVNIVRFSKKKSLVCQILMKKFNLFSIDLVRERFKKNIKLQTLSEQWGGGGGGVSKNYPLCLNPIFDLLSKPFILCVV